jgi:coenzyme F420-0:L-glutamate ligase/coenzyme F420-1:gamma-L-glutamate ligase
VVLTFGVLILEALHANRITLQPHDVVVITQKIVSKAEGRIVDTRDVEPSHMAHMAGKATRMHSIMK